MNAKPPFVSIIVPARNAEAFIAQCVESLLAQDYPRDRYEVIVADNGSTDRTAEVLQAFPVRFVSANRLQSPYAARNDGVRLSMGELVAFCDADGVATTSWLSRLVAALTEDYGGAAGPTFGRPEATGAVADYAAREATFHPSDREMDIQRAPTANVLYRREIFERLGGFREDTLTGADYDFSLRVIRQARRKIRYVPDALIWRNHRTTLRKLLRHEARIAYGREWVSRRHVEPRRSLLGLLGGLAARCALSAGAALCAVLRAPHRRQSWGRAAFVLIGPMMAAANVYGRLRYRLGRDIPPDR
jgi:glycosyltransferase involved in cell wall biosynthesis